MAFSVYLNVNFADPQGLHFNHMSMLFGESPARQVGREPKLLKALVLLRAFSSEFFASEDFS